MKSSHFQVTPKGDPVKHLVAVTLLVLVLHLLAMPAVVFARDLVVAPAGRTNQGMLAIDVPASGQVAIAWRDSDGCARYSFIDLSGKEPQHSKIIDGEPVCGFMHVMLGIRRDNKGVVRIGLNNHRKLIEYTRTPDRTGAQGAVPGAGNLRRAN